MNERNNIFEDPAKSSNTSNFDPYLHKIDSIIIEINKFKDSLTYITIKPKYDDIINKLSLLKSIINSSEYYPMDDEENNYSENMNEMYIGIYSMLNTLVETDSRINKKLIDQFIPNRIICNFTYNYAVQEYTESFKFQSNCEKFATSHLRNSIEDINIFPIHSIFKDIRSLISICNQYKLNISVYINPINAEFQNISIERDESSYSIKYNINDEINCFGELIIYISDLTLKDNLYDILAKIRNHLLSNIEQNMIENNVNTVKYKLSAIPMKLYPYSFFLTISNLVRKDEGIEFDARCSFPHLYEKNESRDVCTHFWIR